MSAMNTVITMAALLGGAYVFVTYIMPQLGNLSNLIPQPIPLSQTAEGKAYQEVFGDWEEEEEEREDNISRIQKQLGNLSRKGLIPTTTTSRRSSSSPERKVIGEIAAVTNPPCTDLTNPVCIEQMKSAAFRNLAPSSTTTTKRPPSPIGSGWL